MFQFVKEISKLKNATKKVPQRQQLFQQHEL